jgi:defect-in-organelle-trafficking protein DotC
MVKSVLKVRSIKALLLISFASIFACTMVACSSSNAPNRDTTTLSSLRSLSRGDSKGAGLTGLRYVAIRDTALSLGARGGLAHRARQINAELKVDARYLERIFNFNAMLLDDNVLPPVLIEGRDTLDQASPDTIRLSDRQYVILSQARFVTTAPHWREYLWMNFPKPELPDPSLLPKDENEERVWDKYVSEGWESGIQQANSIFQENLGRLKRDMEGMIRYRRLLAQGMVSAPFVARMEMGVTGNCDELAINDRILRITALPCFETDSSRWEPITSVMKDRVEPPYPARVVEQCVEVNPDPCPVKIIPEKRAKLFSTTRLYSFFNLKRDCPTDITVINTIRDCPTDE